MSPHRRPLALRTVRDVIEALTGLPVPAYVFDMNTLRFLAANNKFEALLGYSAAELRSMTIADIRPASDIAPLHERLKQGPPPGLVPTQYVRKDQTPLDIKVHYRNVAYTNDAGDAVTGRLVVVEFWSEP